MNDEKIIRFPGGANGRPKGAASSKAEKGVKGEKGGEAPVPAAGGVPDLHALSADQRKAMEIVLSGMSFS